MDIAGRYHHIEHKSVSNMSTGWLYNSDKQYSFNMLISESGDEEGLDPSDEFMFDQATIKVFQVEF